MFGPLVGAVFAQRSAQQPVLRPLHAASRPNRWWLVAWLGPAALAGGALAVSVVLPGVEWSGDLAGVWERLEGVGIPAEALAESRQEKEAASPALLGVMLVVQPLFARPTINAVAVFGEELGWRGFLYRAWGHLGFWRSSLAIGAVWGVWHAPFIIQGHNDPQHPVAGVVVMVVWCMLLAPPFSWLRLRTGSVIGASILHGSLNATAGVPLMFVRGGSDLIVGVTGLSGILVLVGINVLLLTFARDLDVTEPAPSSREG